MSWKATGTSWGHSRDNLPESKATQSFCSPLGFFQTSDCDNETILMCHYYLSNENHWVLFEEKHVTVGYLLVSNILSLKPYLTVQLTILLLEFVRNSQQVPVISLSSIRKHLYIWYSARPFIVTYCYMGFRCLSIHIMSLKIPYWNSTPYPIPKADFYNPHS